MCLQRHTTAIMYREGQLHLATTKLSHMIQTFPERKWFDHLQAERTRVIGHAHLELQVIIGTSLQVLLVNSTEVN